MPEISWKEFQLEHKMLLQQKHPLANSMPPQQRVHHQHQDIMALVLQELERGHQLSWNLILKSQSTLSMGTYLLIMLGQGLSRIFVATLCWEPSGLRILPPTQRPRYHSCTDKSRQLSIFRSNMTSQTPLALLFLQMHGPPGNWLYLWYFIYNYY